MITQWEDFYKKKWRLRYKAPRNGEPAAGNSLREVQQNFETLETEAAWIHDVAVWTFYRTALDVVDEVPVQILLQVHIIKCLDIYEIEIQIPSTTSPKETSWVVICRGHSRHVEEFPHLEPGLNPTSKEWIRERERAVAKKSRIFCWREKPIPHRGNSCVAGTCSCESRVQPERDYSRETKTTGLIFLRSNGTKKMFFQQNRSWDCDAIGIPWDQNCEMRSWSIEAQNSRTWIGLNTSLGEAARSGSNVALVPKMIIPHCIFVPFKDTQVGHG